MNDIKHFFQTLTIIAAIVVVMAVGMSFLIVKMRQQAAANRQTLSVTNSSYVIALGDPGPISVTNTADTPIVPVTDYPCDASLTNYTAVWATPDRSVGAWMNYVAPAGRQTQAQYARTLNGPWFARTPVWVYTNDTQVMCGFQFQFYGQTLFGRTMHN